MASIREEIVIDTRLEGGDRLITFGSRWGPEQGT